MAFKYIGNNSLKTLIGKIINNIPSMDIDDNEVTDLWNTCIIEIGEETELSNWTYTLG